MHTFGFSDESPLHTFGFSDEPQGLDDSPPPPPIQVGRPELDDQGILLCPRCEDTYLHQHEVTVACREEDAPGVLTTVSCQTGALTSRPSTGESGFIGRRDHLTITFRCEGCGGNSVLSVTQHKGNTVVRWCRDAPKP